MNDVDENSDANNDDDTGHAGVPDATPDNVDGNSHTSNYGYGDTGHGGMSDHNLSTSMAPAD